jgi:hypothetical protein
LDLILLFFTTFATAVLMAAVIGFVAELAGGIVLTELLTAF